MRCICGRLQAILRSVDYLQQTVINIPMVSSRRNETVEIFRERLDEVIRQSGLRRSAFARRIGIDRSTLTQVRS